MTARSKRRLASFVLLLVPLALLLVARRFDNSVGLVGKYYANSEWTGAAVSRIDRQIITASLMPLPGPSRNGSFSATWDGFIYVVNTGRYRFQLISDDGAWLEIDGRLVIDNGGHHAPVLKEQSIDLASGLHVIRIEYFQGAGQWRLDFLWAPEGERPVPVAAPSLLHTPMSGTAHAAARTLLTSAPYLPFFWLAAVVLLASDLFLPFLARVKEPVGDPWLWCLVLSSTLLNACGIWWGLSGGRWAADEILPFQVLDGLGSGFSNGWYGPYPPVQYYVLAILYMPFLVANWMVNVDPYPLLHFLNRLASLAMAAGIVVLSYVCAKTLRDRTAGRIAAALTALLLPFVYYAKTGNLDVPYLFWFCWAMVFYARIIVSGDVSSYAGFAVAAALAIATKDQAYGYFVAPAVHIAILRYVRLLNASSGRYSGVARDLVVPRAALIGLATLAVVYNLPFNWSGFIRHVDVITHNAGDRYRMFDRTIEGQLALLRLSLGLVRFSFGWPASLLVAVALVSTLWGRRMGLWLLLPAASYYCAFIAVASIVFDRFVLGICILFAIIAGCAMADWMKSGFRQRWVTAVLLGVVCGYSLLRAASLNAMMVTDSRYYVERWLADVPPAASIGSVGPQTYLPRWRWSSRIDAEDRTAALDADYVVINAEYAQRFGPSSREKSFYDRLRNGGDYALAFRHRTAVNWYPLSRDPVFAQSGETQFTNLDKINPVIEVYRRK